MAESGELAARARAGRRMIGRSVVVGLSGGADSAALAWLASEYADTVRAIHIDHQQPASPALAAASQTIAGQLGMEFDVIGVQVADGASFENLARSARYDALMAALMPGEIVVVAHTLDDQAETVLLQMLRGAGSHGMAGMAMSRGRLVRPLLDVDRATVRAWAEAAALPFVDDPSNTDTAHLRNRVRLQLLPELEAHYQPSAKSVIARSAALSGADDALIEYRAECVPIQTGGQWAAAPIAPLVSLPEAVSSRVVRRALRAVNPPYAGTAEMVAAVLEVAIGGASPVDIGEGVVAFRSEASVVVSVGERPIPEPCALVLGQNDFGQFRFRVTEQTEEPSAFPLGDWTAVLADPEGLRVRSPQAGDVLRLRTGGHKDLADAFAEARVARPFRPSWPVVVDADDVIWWVPGVRRSDVGWGESTSRRYLIVDSVRESH